MWCTIRPLPGAHCFSVLQTRLVWKAPTSSSHQTFILGHLLTPGLRCGGSECARLSAPPFRGPLFQFAASKAFLQSPDQWLSPEFYFRSFAHTHTEIRRPEMCSTICPLLGTHCFSFLQLRHFCKARTNSSHHNFILCHLLTRGLRSGG